MCYSVGGLITSILIFVLLLAVPANAIEANLNTCARALAGRPVATAEMPLEGLGARELVLRSMAPVDTRTVPWREIRAGIADRLRSLILTPYERKNLFKWIIELKLPVHESIIDAVLGIDVRSVTKRIARGLKEGRWDPRFGNEWLWNGMEEMAQTEYARFHQIFSRLKPQPGQVVVDIGCGFGRLGFYLGIFYPGVHFVGYELVSERVEESIRAAKVLALGKNIRFIQQNLADENFEMIAADYYYSWNPVNEITGQKVWAQLERISHLKEYIWINRGLRGAPSYAQDWLVKEHNPLSIYHVRRHHPFP